MPFILRISRVRQVRENLIQWRFSVVGSKTAKITGSKIIKLTQMPKLRMAKIKGFTVWHTFVLHSLLLLLYGCILNSGNNINK